VLDAVKGLSTSGKTENTNTFRPAMLVARLDPTGTPLRLAAPIKLGYKQSKWVTQITVLDELTARRGYRVDKGYEWFAGL
jgi:DMSO/TMAO reductase YedYZ molybdopterin-dependent catalytic subunit